MDGSVLGFPRTYSSEVVSHCKFSRSAVVVLRYLLTFIAVRHKAPIKYCFHCGKRNHAHSKKCNTCGEELPVKEKPPKRKHESLSMKNYEDTIVNKVRGCREVEICVEPHFSCRLLR